MMNAQILVTPQTNHHYHNFITLNPYAPEFHPFYYLNPSPSNYNTTIISTNLLINHPYNYYNYPNNYYYNYPYYLQPSLQLPYYYNHFDHLNASFQEYPSLYLTPFNEFDHNHHQQMLLASTSNDSPYYLHNYQNNLQKTNDHIITMQPHQEQAQPQLVGPAGPHTRGPSPARPKRVEFRVDHQADNSGNVGNSGKKEGCKSNDDNEVKVRVRVRVKNRGRMGNLRGNKEIIMPVKIDGLQTTAMIRNVPNQYTRAMLVKVLDEFCNNENLKLKESTDDHPPLAFDFVYLPIDFKRKANKGYAFVNFTRPIAVWKLHLAFSDRGWDYCNSPKICQIAYASIQGKEKLMEHFGRSRFNCYHEEYLPVCFSPPRDGSGLPVILTTIGERFSLSHNRKE